MDASPPKLRYPGYSLDDLEHWLLYLDRDRFPEIATAIEAEIQTRKAGQSSPCPKER